MIRTIIVAAAIAAAAMGGAPVAAAGGPYANCRQAHKDWRYDIPAGRPGLLVGRGSRQRWHRLRIMISQWGGSK